MRRGGTARLGGRPAENRAFRRALLAWYDTHRRDLPWRREGDPYRIWVAEVMLQQTRVEVVVPAYRRFLRAFPSVARLARSEEERVLSLWSGLGYYARARALHRAARILDASGRRTFPSTMEDARALPGVGPYTAAAVLSIAHGLPQPAVDGNVNRALSRLARLSLPDARGEPHRTLAARLLDRERPGDWNQALMELGQTVCLPRAPRCASCPVRRFCAAERSGRVALHPPRRSRPGTERITAHLTILRNRGGRILLERGAFPHLPHLWLPPIRVVAAGRNAESPLTGAKPLGSFRHAIVRRQFEVQVYTRTLSSGEERALGRGRSRTTERRLFDARGLAAIGRSSLLTKALHLVAAATGGRARPGGGAVHSLCTRAAMNCFADRSCRKSPQKGSQGPPKLSLNG